MVPAVTFRQQATSHYRRWVLSIRVSIRWIRGRRVDFCLAEIAVPLRVRLNFWVIAGLTRSVLFRTRIAPEMRAFRFPQNIHRVPDYMGVGQEEKLDAHPRDRRDRRAATATPTSSPATASWPRTPSSSQAIEDAGHLLHRAVLVGDPPRGREGRGQEARAKPRQRGDPGHRQRLGPRPASSGPATARPSRRSPSKHALGLHAGRDAVEPVEDNAEQLLQAGYAASDRAGHHRGAPDARPSIESEKIWAEYPGKRIRFKCIGGGGGKGQRVVIRQVRGRRRRHGHPGRAEGRRARLEPELPDRAEPRDHPPQRDPGHRQRRLVRSRSGGRDCSIQMHEQKQLEFSLTEELLDEAIPRYQGTRRARPWRATRETLRAMEARRRASSARASVSTASRPSSASSRVSITSSWR